MDLEKKMTMQRYKNMVRIHEDMVAYYTHVLCLDLGINPEKATWAAMYHDHGKFLWDMDLFTLPFSKMTKEHWEIIRNHPRSAGEVIFTEMPLEKYRFLKGDPSIMDLIILHHEKPDGSGYYGVKDIPVEAAIISIADVFDACLSDRPYRDSMMVETALEQSLKPFRKYLKKEGYDPKEVERCLKKSAIKLQAEYKNLSAL